MELPPIESLQAESEEALKFQSYSNSELATNELIHTIAANTAYDLKSVANIKEANDIPTNNMSGFMQAFGYNPDATSFKALTKNHFMVTSVVNNVAITEVIQWFDFKDDMESVNQARRVSVDGILITNRQTNKTFKLADCSAKRGFTIQYMTKEFDNPKFAQTQRFDMVQTRPLGSIEHDPKVSLELLHELRHAAIPTETLSEIEEETLVSTEVLKAILALREEGIDLYPDNIEEARKYLQGRLNTYMPGGLRRKIDGLIGKFFK
jgi:hypothetical protein